MERKVGAERVGRSPRDAVADVLRFRGDELIQKRDADKDDRGPRQRVERHAKDRRVDEIPEQLRTDEL